MGAFDNVACRGSQRSVDNFVYAAEPALVKLRFTRQASDLLSIRVVDLLNECNVVLVSLDYKAGQ